MAHIIAITFDAAPRLARETARSGGLIVLPTDTVYGVGCALDNDAIAHLYAAKQRPIDRAVPVLLADADAVAQVARTFPAAAQRLAAAFWPGPLTLVLPKHDDLPPNLSQLPTVGVRVPDHDGARRIIAAVGGALAVTSANRSEALPAQDIQGAIAQLGDAVTLYLDGGASPGGVPSTVVAFDSDELRVLRAGPIAEDQLRAALTT